MLYIDRHTLNWPLMLEPRGEGDFEKEPFEEWWGRNKAHFPHLDPRIVEQWVYRHWRHSPYCCLELERLSWRLERWPSTCIIDDVSMPGWTLDPIFDYQAFNRSGKHPTARAMDPHGKWDYPIIVLSTPEGFCDRVSEEPDARFLLIEGHCRRRYLNALMARGEAAAEQHVFLLEYR